MATTPPPTPEPRPFTPSTPVTDMSKKAIMSRLFEYMENGYSMTRAAKQPGMMSYASLNRTANSPQYADQYARARQALYDYWAAELTDIADDAANDFVETDQGPKFNAEAVARSRVRIDTRKWLLSKLMPKQFGDKSTVEMSGPDGGAIKTEGPMQPTLEDLLAAAKVAAESVVQNGKSD